MRCKGMGAISRPGGRLGCVLHPGKKLCIELIGAPAGRSLADWSDSVEYELHEAFEAPVKADVPMLVALGDPRGKAVRDCSPVPMQRLERSGNGLSIGAAVSLEL